MARRPLVWPTARSVGDSQVRQVLRVSAGQAANAALSYFLTVFVPVLSRSTSSTCWCVKLTIDAKQSNHHMGRNLL